MGTSTVQNQKYSFIPSGSEFNQRHMFSKLPKQAGGKRLRHRLLREPGGFEGFRPAPIQADTHYLAVPQGEHLTQLPLDGGPTDAAVAALSEQDHNVVASVGISDDLCVVLAYFGLAAGPANGRSCSLASQSLRRAVRPLTATD